MSFKHVKALVLGLVAASALAFGATGAMANSGTITLNTNGGFTATSAGLLTLNDNGFGTITCNVSLTGAVTSGVYTGTGSTLVQFGAVTGGSATNCNQSLTVTLQFPTGGWTLNGRANDFTLNTSTNKITQALIALNKVQFTIAGAAVGGSVVYGGTANPGTITPKLDNTPTTIYPITQGTLVSGNELILSNAIGGNSLNSNSGTTGSLIGTFSVSPAINAGGSITP